MLSYLKVESASPIEGFPQSSVGAPCPVVLASEHSMFVVFYLQQKPESWDGTTVRVVDVEEADEPIAVVAFDRCTAHTFGPPNDEAFSGHPLAKKGLEPYGAFTVQNSSWLARLEKINSVHPRHNKERYMEGKQHFILTFHDSVFECIALGYKVSFSQGSIKELLPSLIGELRG